MASKAKRPAKKKVSAKKPAKKRLIAKKATKQIRKAKSVGKTVRSVGKSVRRETTAAKQASKGIMQRAVEAIVQVAEPLMPGNADEKPKDEDSK